MTLDDPKPDENSKKGHWSNAQFDSTDFSGLVNALDNIVELVEESQTTTDQASTRVVPATTDSPATTKAVNVTVATESAEGILLMTLM